MSQRKPLAVGDTIPVILRDKCGFEYRCLVRVASWKMDLRRGEVSDEQWGTVDLACEIVGSVTASDPQAHKAKPPAPETKGRKP